MNNFRETPVWTNARKSALAALLFAQGAVAYVIGTEHLLANEFQSLMPPIGVTAVVPVMVFLAAYGISPGFREFILAQDLKMLTMMQLWRVIGFGFLPLYAFGILPGLFALPAGLGDVAVGLIAILIVARLNRIPDYARSNGYLRFQILGLFDFAVAIAASGLTSGAIPGLIDNGVTSAAMDVWPLNIFPSFIVPAFIILQLSALLKVREMHRQSSTDTTSVPNAA